MVYIALYTQTQTRSNVFVITYKILHNFDTTTRLKKKLILKSEKWLSVSLNVS